jgi:NAD-reducing hydrogenase large subunit
VGPLARLNIVKSMGTPKADKELAEFKQLAAGPVESSFHYHHARLIEMRSTASKRSSRFSAIR